MMRKIKHQLGVFYSYFRLLISFYIFKKYRNLNYSQISFIHRSLPKDKGNPDHRFMLTILDYNLDRLNKQRGIPEIKSPQPPPFKPISVTPQKSFSGGLYIYTDKDYHLKKR